MQCHSLRTLVYGAAADSRRPLIMNGVLDAIRDRGITEMNTPVTPARV
jgi:hypothetical protein